MKALLQNNNLKNNIDNAALSSVKIKKEPVNNEESDIRDHLLNSPIVPSEVYSVLPNILKDGSYVFSTSREKDVFLTGAITVLSGCFPTIYGIYDNKKVHANLFCFIIAPPASGKGSLVCARDLAMGIHNKLINGHGGSLNLTTDQPFLDVNEFLFLPGNISAAAMISRLHDNSGTAIICETEADSLSNCLSQDWGNFSDLLRKAFQHEPFSYARVTRNQFIEIPRPKLSVALTGTPNQMKPLMRSVQDGLFSRFIFYTYRTIPKWRDPSQKNGFIYDSYIQGLQERINSVYDFTRDQEYCFDLSVLQWLKLNKLYDERLRNSVMFVGEDTSATVFRLALIHFRIAMTLSILRHFESGTEGNFIGCEDIDYSIAELLTELYLDHSLLVYKILTDQLDTGLGAIIDKFYKALPDVAFRRKEAVDIAVKLGIAERSVNKYLKRLKEYGFLKQDVAQGPYQKVTV